MKKSTKKAGVGLKAYDPAKIEAKWQRKWRAAGIFKAKENKKKEKYYILDMFPYPSGEGLHVGHPKGYIATDIISRYRRMKGHSVLHPMGFDAFGLPAENYALKTKTNPVVSVAKNVARYKKQLEIFGCDYDWSREVNTTDSKYYKWTQWIFLKLLERGLAYESYEPINWCPSCKTGLANEDVEDGHCERCGTLVEKKPMRQWVLKITDYAERLLNDLDIKKEDGKALLDWPESIKILQRNWIGRSEGALIKFNLVQHGPKGQNIEVFTTRIDTIFSGTFVVVSPEHKIIDQLKDQITNIEEVNKFIDLVKNKTELERLDKNNKDGVQLKGVMAINPATQEEIQIWVSDFVLGDYGTGAVFADAHDKRDFDMAKKYNIPLKVSLKSEDIILNEKYEKLEECFEGDGILINSGEFTGLKSAEARPKIIKWLSEKGLARSIVKYKLRDWVFSRQRYWGEPIPVIHCENCKLINPEGNGIVPVPEKDLPVVLPKVKSYEPTGTGESPLAAITKWVNVKCPVCGGKAKRETNTMPQWAGSSWYYLRYTDPKNKKALASRKNLDYWFGNIHGKNENGGVDLYVGGAEHATRHLIYARFWHKFLFDLGIVPNTEPFLKLQHVGLIMGEDGRKMSKRFGNVVNPDEIVKTYGADTLRMYEMFMGPFDQQISWSTESIIGTRRFLEKVVRIAGKVKKDKDIEENSRTAMAKLDILVNKTIKKVSDDIENIRLNTAISSLMICANEMDSLNVVSSEIFAKYLKLLAPFAPHLAEEIWFALGNKKSVHISSWPEFNSEIIKEETVKIAVQVNGKLRATLEVDANATEATVIETAKNAGEVSKWIVGKEIKKTIFIPAKIVNFVVA